MSEASPAPARAQRVGRVNTTSILYDWGFSRPNSIDLWDGVTNKPVRAVNVWGANVWGAGNARRGASFNRENLIIPSGSHGVVLLWALACEIDDRGSTFTGDRVCRACSGRGWTFRERTERLIYVTLCPIETEVRPTSCHLPGLDPSKRQERWSLPLVPAMTPCTCTGPTRPDTVSLAWLVSHLAHQRSPQVTDWPDQWVVDCEQRDADGADTWVTTWWRAFRDWTIAGREPDDATTQALARALDWALKYPGSKCTTRRPEIIPELRPWFSIGDGNGRVYVDDFSVDRRSNERVGGADGVSSFIDNTTCDITIVMSCDVTSIDYEHHVMRTRQFERMENQPVHLTICGGSIMYSFADAFASDVSVTQDNYTGRIVTTTRLVSGQGPMTVRNATDASEVGQS